MTLTILVLSVWGWYHFTGRFRNMFKPIAKFAVFSYLLNFALKTLAYAILPAVPAWYGVVVVLVFISKGVVGRYVSSSWKDFIGVVWIGIIAQILCYSYVDLLVFSFGS